MNGRRAYIPRGGFLSYRRKEKDFGQNTPFEQIPVEYFQHHSSRTLKTTNTTPTMAPTYDTSVFISPRLEILLPSDVPESQSPCGICYDYYTASAARSARVLVDGEEEDDEDYDEPAIDLARDPRRLPCSHVFCSACIHRALANSPNCPYCATRHRVRATPTQGLVLAELSSLLDDALESDGRLDAAVARLLLWFLLSPFFVAVVLSMDVGPRHQPDHRLRRTGVLSRAGLVGLTALSAPLIYALVVWHVTYIAWRDAQEVEDEALGNAGPRLRMEYFMRMRTTEGETRVVPLRQYLELTFPDQDLSHLEFIDGEYLSDEEVLTDDEDEDRDDDGWEYVDDSRGNVLLYRTVVEVRAPREGPEEAQVEE